MDETVKLTIEVPKAVQELLPDAERELKRLLAMKLYQNGRVSIGYAAEVAGMYKAEFETLLFDNNIPLRGPSFEQVTEDIRRHQEARLKEKQAALRQSEPVPA
jgi:predicted HTH domain antitoxin